jgi:DUF1707 SHOCT-like domain
MRASDADREHVAERLREAAAEGRLLAEELEQRLATALRARTYGELDPIVADLPVKRAPQRTPRIARPLLALAIAAAVAIVVAVAALVIMGVVAIWAVWMLCGWWCFGGRRAYYYRRRALRHGQWQVSRQATPRAWL